MMRKEYCNWNAHDQKRFPSHMQITVIKILTHLIMFNHICRLLTREKSHLNCDAVDTDYTILSKIEDV